MTIERLGQRDIGRVVARDVFPKLPHTPEQPQRSESTDPEERPTPQRLAPDLLGDRTTCDLTSQRMGDLGVDKMGNRQHLIHHQSPRVRIVEQPQHDR